MRRLLFFLTTVLLLVGCSDVSQAQQTDTAIHQTQRIIPPPPVVPPPPEPKSEEIFRAVQYMPQFPGCVEKGRLAALTDCTQSKLTEFIYSHLVYPPQAKANSIEGICVVQFVVEPDGSISTVELLRDIGYGCGEAAVRAVSEMRRQHLKWTAGTDHGDEVHVRLVMPVKFDLSKQTE
ncbi:MAG: energy transducer TonB [Bacteroidota bacterium]